MCGIAGLLGAPPADFARRVGPALRHRGPDGDGHWQDEHTCLLHRRLAVVDLSSAGQQPLASACGRWRLVFNGEIYNHNELRAELLRDNGSSAPPVRFRGSGDSEVLLAWLLRHGAAGLPQLRGMYAFCLYDRRERTALLARDPHGIKPLCLWRGPGGVLAFASELRALLAWGRPGRQLNPSALAAFLAWGSVPEPSALVAGIERLPAGHLALWQQGRLRLSPWGPLPESLAPAAAGVWDPRVASGRTRQALRESLSAHLIADVPVGLFLSGGLDSGALLALAPAGLPTFTLGHDGASDGADPDESMPAARLAHHFGCRHTTLTLTAGQVQRWLPAFLEAQDQPSQDGFNSWCVARLARGHGLKVAISGVGGDELFGGYPSFTAVPQLLRWRQRLAGLGPGAAWGLQRLGHHRAQRLAALLAAPASLTAAYGCWRGLFSPAEITALLRHWGLELPAGSPELSPPAELHPLDRIAWLEGSRYLRQQLLADADAMTMAHGLELRLPFVDAVLQRSLAPIPAPQRLAAGKQLLMAAVPELPAWFRQRPKQGFQLPFQAWLDAPQAQLRLPLPAVPAQLDLRPWYRRWSLMVLQHWLAAHLGLELRRQR